MEPPVKYHFDAHLDPKQKFCAIKSEDGFHFAKRKSPQMPLCGHKLCRQCLFKWIGRHASKTDATLCPACLFVGPRANANTNAKPWIILTAPHSNCSEANKNDSGRHDCDFSAMRMAESMRKALEREGFAVAMFPDKKSGETADWRPIYDENRPSGGYIPAQSDSPMRQSFKSFYRKAVNENEMEIVLALDVHSYPDEFCYAPKQRIWHQKKRDCIGIYDFFVLDNTAGPSAGNPTQKKLEEHFSYLTAQFVKRARAMGATNLGYREGSRDQNYIQAYFRANGTPSFLLETNEKLKDDQLESAATIFAKAIASSFRVNAIRLNVGALGTNDTDPRKDEFVSPVYGIVVSDRKMDSWDMPEMRELNIYIAPENIHTVFAPTTNFPSRIWTEMGDWDRYDPTLFHSHEKHKGRVHFQWGPKNYGISFALEVGKGYITDTVRVDIKENEQTQRGNVIGEILIGSTALIYYDSKQWKLLVSPHQKVIGGKTPLFKRIKAQ